MIHMAWGGGVTCDDTHGLGGGGVTCKSRTCAFIDTRRVRVETMTFMFITDFAQGY